MIYFKVKILLIKHLSNKVDIFYKPSIIAYVFVIQRSNIVNLYQSIIAYNVLIISLQKETMSVTSFRIHLNIFDKHFFCALKKNV